MKKFSLIISFTLLISSLFCIFAGATGGPVIESQELYAEIPAGYEFSPYYEDDLYFTYVNDDSTSLFIDIQSNKYVKDGISKLTEKQIQERVIIDFILEGDQKAINDYTAKFSDVSLETINGVKMYKFIGAFAWKEEGIADENLSYSGIGGYVTATKDNIYYFVFMDYDEVFDETDDLIELMSSVSVNGPYFDGDKTTVDKDFASFETYSQVLSDELYTYWSDFEDFYYDDEYYSDEDYAEIGNITYGIGIAMVLMTVIPTLIVLIIAIVLIIKYCKKKKKLNELEKQQFAGNVYQQGMQYQPYGTQPYAQTSQPANTQFAYQPMNAQPASQPVYAQPVPQPINAEITEQKTILNGEIQDNNQ